MKIHYHSECSFFAGCERMLIQFLQSDMLRAGCDVSFSFPRNMEYETGFRKKITPDFPVIRLHTLSGDFPKEHFEGRRKFFSKGLRFLNRLILTAPLLIWEILLGVFILRRVRPDVLHLNNGGYPAARSVRAMAIAGSITRVPTIVMVVNNIAQPYNTLGRIVMRPVDRLVCRSVDRFICGSKHAGKKLREVLDLPENTVVSIPNGYNKQPIQESAAAVRARLGLKCSFKGLVFGAVALMVPRKGHSVLIDALEQLMQVRPDLENDLQVFLEGDGPLLPELKAQVERAGLGSVVHFVPVEARIADFIHALDILILPSIANEDFPNVVIEAMGYAKPVIASAIAGTPEQVDDGETGILVEPGDPASLAKAIVRFVSDTDFQHKTMLAAQEKFDKRFTAKIAVQSYLNLYHSLEKIL